MVAFAFSVLLPPCSLIQQQLSFKARIVTLRIVVGIIMANLRAYSDFGVTSPERLKLAFVDISWSATRAIDS